MLTDHLQELAIGGLIVAFLVWRQLRFRKVRAQLPALLEAGALLVDVRSPGEFECGHHPGSLNVPLGELEARARDWDRNGTIVLCCASGARSGMAAGLLRKGGFKRVINTGPWTNTLG